MDQLEQLNHVLVTVNGDVLKLTLELGSEPMTTKSKDEGICLFIVPQNLTTCTPNYVVYCYSTHDVHSFISYHIIKIAITSSQAPNQLTTLKQMHEIQNISTSL